MTKEGKPIKYLIHVSDLKEYSRLGETGKAMFFLTRASLSRMNLVFLSLESNMPKSHRFQHISNCG